MSEIEKHKTRAKQALMDYRTVFGSEAGKRILRSLMAETGYFSSEVPPTGEQAIALAAKRSIVASILRGMKTKPEEIESYYEQYQEDTF